MFRKLVSNLPFSPALVGQLGFYAKRLRKEQFTRRLGLFFTIFAVIIQSFAVFSPAEQVSAATGSSIIDGGVKSVQDVLNVYDAGAQGHNDFKDITDYLGITRAELAAMSNEVKYVCSTDDNKSIISFGRQHHYSAAEGELVHNIPRQNGGFSTLYSVPLYRFDSVHNRPVNCYDSYVGYSANVGWFAIMRKCGNLQIKRNVQKFPKGHLVTASCKTIQGFAYDERQTNLRAKVYLYFNGPPGKGTQYGPIMANQATPSAPIGSGYGFSFAVPDEFQKSTPTEVWAVMQPLPGWNQNNVQFDNTLVIPGGCIPTQTPVAACSTMTINKIDRTHISIDAYGTAAQGASITGYQLAIQDKSGKKIYDKTYNSSATKLSSEKIELKIAGDYNVKVVLKTSIGDKESAECTSALTVVPPDKCPYTPALSATDPDCKPCPYNPNIWIKDENCSPVITQSKEARNVTQAIANANGTTAGPSDRIEYTIYTTNVGNVATTTTITENLGDVLEYADLSFNGGGIFDPVAKTLTWENVTVNASATDSRTFAVQIKPTIAATPRAGNDPAAYDCVITNSYGNTINISMQCPIVKSVETSVQQLPVTGPTENMIFAGALLMVVTYFYARSRLLNKEVRIIRKEFNTGTL